MDYKIIQKIFCYEKQTKIPGSNSVAANQTEIFKNKYLLGVGKIEQVKNLRSS